MFDFILTNHEQILSNKRKSFERLAIELNIQISDIQPVRV